jgi:hypothetical protein
MVDKTISVEISGAQGTNYVVIGFYFPVTFDKL